MASLADPGRGGKQEVARARARAPRPHARPSVRGGRQQEELRWWVGPEQELGQAGKSGKALPFLFSVSFVFIYTFCH